MTKVGMYTKELTECEALQLLRLAENNHYKLVSLYPITSTKGELITLIVNYSHVDTLDRTDRKQTSLYIDELVDVKAINNGLRDCMRFNSGTEWFVDEKSNGFLINYTCIEEVIDG